ncbi:MarR family winged helix-turn-helix transcriptional regulator [Chitiniphilus purpureus]|uniref:MarR family winged helix-turn-helix transcriptional regulator n=1 Tax=Chitiniphilus purpureus TaxID=2981137 RepID=A0ABY6DRU7_9NEIS|nr:MarR family winged helix-turn-helix transcriptional regulator [Chitiniphilus sp. CD1]UXY17095.1 MarR family winged helix-turn-helix transcriptional regulator [Chitiniphilus sp. CD1]
MTTIPQLAPPPAVAPEQDLPLAVLQKFRLIIAAMQEQYRNMYRQSGLSGAQLWFLKEVGKEPGLTLGQVAQRLTIHQSTASNQLEKLARRGLVQRIKGDTDRRVTRLQLTPAGHAALGRVTGPTRGLLQETLLTLPRDELVRLDHSLAVLVQRLEPWLDDADQAAHTPLASLLNPSQGGD